MYRKVNESEWHIRANYDFVLPLFGLVLSSTSKTTTLAHATARKTASVSLKNSRVRNGGYDQEQFLSGRLAVHWMGNSLLQSSNSSPPQPPSSSFRSCSCFFFCGRDISDLVQAAVQAVAAAGSTTHRKNQHKDQPPDSLGRDPNRGYDSQFLHLTGPSSSLLINAFEEQSRGIWQESKCHSIRLAFKPTQRATVSRIAFIRVSRHFNESFLGVPIVLRHFRFS